MRLAAGERRGGAVERQIAEAQGQQYLQAREDLAHDALAHGPLALAELQPAERLSGARQRQPHDVGDREARQPHRQALRPQPRAAAGAADLLAQIGAQVLEGLAAVRALFLAGRGVEPQQGLQAAAQVRHDTREAGLVPEQQDLSRLRGQLRDRHLEREAVALGDLDERLAHEAWAVTMPRPDRPVRGRSCSRPAAPARRRPPSVGRGRRRRGRPPARC